jgi:hypothetical protein
LLITITLLSFLVLLLVSLASLTRVESQVASNSQQLGQARQNALLALNIAIGQLQKYAGPDQRVTATADLAGDSAGVRLVNDATPANTTSLSSVTNGLSKVQPGTRYWTGVWGNSHLSTDIYTKSPGPVLLNWLVSGNEKVTFTQPNPTLGQITGSNGGNGSVAPVYNPANITVLPTGVTAIGSITGTNGKQEDTVLLVGSATAGDSTTTRTLADSSSENYYDRYVVAPLVSIKAPVGSVPGLAAQDSPEIGRYAYWVGDEGVKAKYNVVDTYASYTSPTDTTVVQFKTSEGNTLETTSGALARYRLMAAQRSGIEGLAGLNYDVNATAVSRVVEPAQIRFAGTSAVTNAQQQVRVHDVTTHSSGVLADTLSGGLRKDLTSYFETAGAFASLAGANIIPTGSPTKGPKWDLIKSYYSLADTARTGTVEIRPATTTQMGIFPIVSDVRLLFGLAPSNPSDFSKEAIALFNPLIVLTNPYNVSLKASDGLYVQFKLTPIPGIPVSESRGELAFDGIRYTGSASGSAGNYRALTRAGSGRSSLLDGVVFKLPVFTLAPGGSAIFSITSNQVNVTAGTPVALAQGAPIGSTFNYYGKTVPGSNLSSANYKLEDYGNSTPIDIEFYTASSLVATTLAKRIGALDVDCSTADGKPPGNTARQSSAFPLGVFLANLNYPADSTPSSGTANQNRTMRLFADFNLRAANSRRILWLYSAPPYYRRWVFGSGGSWGTSVPADFTQYLGSGNAYWGRDHTVSLQDARFFDLPPRADAKEMPVLSLAQLQHADLTADDDVVGVGHQPGYAVGNSFWPPYLARGKTTESRKDWYTKTTSIYEEAKNYYDISYLLNCALWDRYFFSAIPLSEYESVNARIRFAPDAALAAKAASDKTTAVHDPNLAARYLMTDGAFNINSTSIEAWKATLGGTRGLKMPGDSQPDAAFPRSVRQPGEAKLPKATGDEADTYTGFRRLDDTQLTSLAVEIVKQVRLRGPFVSLAQFVNRSLDSTSPFALQGPLQAAIESAGGGLNEFSSSAAEKTKDKVDITSTADSTPSFTTGSYTGTQSFGTYRIFPDSTVPPTSEQGYRSTAAPGWLTQADVLQAIAPVLSTRSDTFVIRTYGDVMNPTTGSTAPIARAWCEAVVQRMPDYVDTSNNAEIAPATANLTNQTYGRRFKVVSFRWLSPADI